MVSVEELRSLIETQEVGINKKTMKKEGTDSVEDFIREVAGDFLKQEMSSANYFPVRLDPTIYNVSVLYGMSPVLTYLESRGRKSATGDTKIEYIRYTSGFTGEWIGETDNTTGTGEAVTGTETANMYFLAMPIAMSDLIGKGASSRARVQLMDFAQQGLREELNAKIVAGTGADGQFKGLDKHIEDSGTRVDLSGEKVTLNDVRALETSLLEDKKVRPSFIMASNSVVDQLVDEMQSNVSYTAGGMQGLDIVAGINVPKYNSNTGPIPIIQDPNVPKTAKQRRLDMLNEQHVFIEEFMSPAFIQEGRSKPFASSGWLGQIIVMYDVAPELGGQIYNID